MQKIVPHLWFDTQAKEATEFYVSLFPDSEITSLTVLHDTPSGDCDSLRFKLWGQEFMSISAGPYFTKNPSISFMVNFDPSVDKDAKAHMDVIWEKLLDGAKVLMPLDKYPFSEHYGWIEDKFGVSWQLILTRPEGEPRPPIMPALLFVNEASGKTQEATEFYLSVFQGAPHASNDTRRGTLALYPKEMPDRAGEVMFTDIELAGRWVVAMDGGSGHAFAFNEGISLMIPCEDQAEIDYFWDKLSSDPKAEQCGWCKDKFGVSWQVTPKEMDTMMAEGTQEQIDRVTKAFMPMKKFDLAALRKAYQS